MRLNNFTLEVTGHKEDDNGYVALPHKGTFSLKLGNFRSQPCDAEIFIQGKSQGKFRISPWGAVTIERPGQDGQNKLFTFFAAGSAEATKVGYNANNELNGLVKVVFVPGTEKYLPKVGFSGILDEGWGKVTFDNNTTYRGGSKIGTLSAANVSGIVGLSGQSKQQFFSVEELNYDYSQSTNIYLRIIEAQIDAEPLQESSYSSKIPPYKK